MVKIYVEGGGDANALRTVCRRGFSRFFGKAGLAGKMPRIVACGSRENAYDSFCTAMRKGEKAFLLVDSEGDVSASCRRGDPSDWKPWEHLGGRAGGHWRKPEGADGTDCHLMVQCMETWFLADREALKSFFGFGFNEGALPKREKPVESVAKADVFKSLADASRGCRVKGKYDKGKHSFQLLGMIDPLKVSAASPWAKRAIDALSRL